LQNSNYPSDHKVSALQLENIPWWGKNILRGAGKGGANEHLGGKIY